MPAVLNLVPVVGGFLGSLVSSYSASRVTRRVQALMAEIEAKLVGPIARPLQLRPEKAVNRLTSLWRRRESNPRPAVIHRAAVTQLNLEVVLVPGLPTESRHIQRRLTGKHLAEAESTRGGLP